MSLKYVVPQGNPSDAVVCQGYGPGSGEDVHKGTSLIRTPPPQDHHGAIGKVLLYGPRRGVFLMSEVPL